MHTSTASSSFISTESVLCSMARAFVAGVVRALERTGRACQNGTMPI